MPGTPKDATSGSKAQDVEWFASDVTPIDDSKNRARQFRVHVAASFASATEYEYSLDSGTTWVIFDGGLATAEIARIFTIPVREGDTFNIRFRNVAGTTVRFCRVDELFDV